MSKTDYAHGLFPTLSDSYARARLYDEIVSHPRLLRLMLDAGWKPGKKLLCYRELRVLNAYFKGEG